MLHGVDKLECRPCLDWRSILEKTFNSVWAGALKSNRLRPWCRHVSTYLLNTSLTFPIAMPWIILLQHVAYARSICTYYHRVATLALASNKFLAWKFLSLCSVETAVRPWLNKRAGVVISLAFLKRGNQIKPAACIPDSRELRRFTRTKSAGVYLLHKHR